MSARLRGKASAYSKKTAKKPREEAPPPEPEVKEQSLEQAIQESYEKYADFFPDSYVQRLQSRGIIEKPQVRAKRPSPQQRPPEPPKPIIPEARAEVITPDETLTPEYWETRARGQFDFMPGQNIGIQSTGPLATPQTPPPQQPTDRVGIVRQQLQDELSDQQRKLQETLEIIRIERARVRSTSNDASVDTENEATMRKLSPRYTQLAAERESLLADINDIQNQITLLDADIEQRASEAQSGAFDPLESAGQSFSGIPADNPMENPKGLAPVTVPAETPAARARATGTTGTIVDPNFTLGDFSKDAIKFMGIPTTEGIPGMALSQREQEQQSFIPTAYAEEQQEPEMQGPIQPVDSIPTMTGQQQLEEESVVRQPIEVDGQTFQPAPEVQEQPQSIPINAIDQFQADVSAQGEQMLGNAAYSPSSESTMDQSIMEFAGYEKLGESQPGSRLDSVYAPTGRVTASQGFISASPGGGIIAPRTVEYTDKDTGEIKSFTSSMQVGGIDPSSPEGQVIQEIYARQAKDRFENLKQREYITALRDGKVSFREALTEPRTTQTFVTGGVKTPGVNPERIANIEQFFNERGISMDETMRSLNLRGDDRIRDTASLIDPTKPLGDLRDLTVTAEGVPDPSRYRRFADPEFPATGISTAQKFEQEIQQILDTATSTQKQAIQRTQEQAIKTELDKIIKDNNWGPLNTPDTEWVITYLPEGETFESLREKQQKATLSSWTDEALLDEFGIGESVKYSELPSSIINNTGKVPGSVVPQEFDELQKVWDAWIEDGKDGTIDNKEQEDRLNELYQKWATVEEPEKLLQPGDVLRVEDIDRTAIPSPGTVSEPTQTPEGVSPIPPTAAGFIGGATTTAQFLSGLGSLQIPSGNYLSALGNRIVSDLPNIQINPRTGEFGLIDEQGVFSPGLFGGVPSADVSINVPGVGATFFTPAESRVSPGPSLNITTQTGTEGIRALFDESNQAPRPNTPEWFEYVNNLSPDVQTIYPPGSSIPFEGLAVGAGTSGRYADTGELRPVLETPRVFYRDTPVGPQVADYVRPPTLPLAIAQKYPEFQRAIDNLFVDPARQEAYKTGQLSPDGTPVTARDIEEFKGLQSDIAGWIGPYTDITQMAQAALTPDAQGRLFDPNVAKSIREQGVLDKYKITSDGILESNVFAMLTKSEKLDLVDEDLFAQGIVGTSEAVDLALERNPDATNQGWFSGVGALGLREDLTPAGAKLQSTLDSIILQIAKNPRPFIGNMISNALMFASGRSVYNTVTKGVLTAQESGKNAGALFKAAQTLQKGGKVSKEMANILTSPKLADRLGKIMSFVIVQDFGAGGDKILKKQILKEGIMGAAPGISNKIATKVSNELYKVIKSAGDDIEPELEDVLDFVKNNENKLKAFAEDVAEQKAKQPIDFATLTDFKPSNIRLAVGAMPSLGVIAQEEKDRTGATALGAFFNEDRNLALRDYIQSRTVPVQRFDPVTGEPKKPKPAFIQTVFDTSPIEFKVLPRSDDSLLPGFGLNLRQREIEAGAFGPDAPQFNPFLRQSSIAETGATPATDFFTGQSQGAFSAFTSTVTKKITGEISDKRSNLLGRRAKILDELKTDNEKFAEGFVFNPYADELSRLTTLTNKITRAGGTFRNVKKQIERTVKAANQDIMRSEMNIERARIWLNTYRGKSELDKKGYKSLAKSLKEYGMDVPDWRTAKWAENKVEVFPKGQATRESYSLKQLDQLLKDKKITKTEHADLTKKVKDKTLISLGVNKLAELIEYEQNKIIITKGTADDYIFGKTQAPDFANLGDFRGQVTLDFWTRQEPETLIINPQELAYYNEGSKIYGLNKANQELTDAQIEFDQVMGALDEVTKMTKDTLKARYELPAGDPAKLSKKQYKAALKKIDQRDKSLNRISGQLTELAQLEKRVGSFDQTDTQQWESIFGTAERLLGQQGKQIVNEKTKKQLKTKIAKRLEDKKRIDEASTPEPEQPTTVIGAMPFTGLASNIKAKDIVNITQEAFRRSPLAKRENERLSFEKNIVKKLTKTRDKLDNDIKKAKQNVDKAEQLVNQADSKKNRQSLKEKQEKLERLQRQRLKQNEILNSFETRETEFNTRFITDAAGNQVPNPNFRKDNFDIFLYEQAMEQIPYEQTRGLIPSLGRLGRQYDKTEVETKGFSLKDWNTLNEDKTKLQKKIALVEAEYETTNKVVWKEGSRPKIESGDSEPWKVYGFNDQEVFAKQQEQLLKDKKITKKEYNERVNKTPRSKSSIRSEIDELNQQLNDVNDELSRRSYSDSSDLFLSNTTTRDDPALMMNKFIGQMENIITTATDNPQLKPKIKTTQASLNYLKKLRKEKPNEYKLLGKRMQADIEEAISMTKKDSGLRISLREINVEEAPFGKTLKAKVLRRPWTADNLLITSDKKRFWNKVMKKPNLVSWTFEIEGTGNQDYWQRALGVELEPQNRVASLYDEDAVIFTGGRAKATDKDGNIVEFDENAIREYKEQKTPYSAYVTVQQLQGQDGVVKIDSNYYLDTADQTKLKGGTRVIDIDTSARERQAVINWIRENKNDLKNGRKTLDDFELTVEMKKTFGDDFGLSYNLDPYAKLKIDENIDLSKAIRKGEWRDLNYKFVINPGKERLNNRAKAKAEATDPEYQKILADIKEQEKLVDRAQKNYDKAKKVKTTKKKPKSTIGKIAQIASDKRSGKAKARKTKQAKRTLKKLQEGLKDLEEQQESIEKTNLITSAAEELLETASKTFETNTNPRKITNFDVLNSKALQELKTTIFKIGSGRSDSPATDLLGALNVFESTIRRTKQTAEYLTDQTAKKGTLEQFDETSPFTFTAKNDLIAKKGDDDVTELAQKLNNELEKYEQTLWGQLGEGPTKAYLNNKFKAKYGEGVDKMTPSMQFARESTQNDGYVSMNYALTKAIQEAEINKKLEAFPPSFKKNYQDLLANYETIVAAKVIREKGKANPGEMNILETADKIDSKKVQNKVVELAQKLDTYRQAKIFSLADINVSPTVKLEKLKNSIASKNRKVASLDRQIESIEEEMKVDLDNMNNFTVNKEGKIVDNQTGVIIDPDEEYKIVKKRIETNRTKLKEKQQKLVELSQKKQKAENDLEEYLIKASQSDEKLAKIQDAIRNNQIEFTNDSYVDLANWLNIPLTFNKEAGALVPGLFRKVKGKLVKDSKSRKEFTLEEGVETFGMKNIDKHIRINKETGMIQVNLAPVNGEIFDDPITYTIIQKIQQSEMEGGMTMDQIVNLMQNEVAKAKAQGKKVKTAEEYEKAMRPSVVEQQKLEKDIKTIEAQYDTTKLESALADLKLSIKTGKFDGNTTEAKAQMERYETQIANKKQFLKNDTDYQNAKKELAELNARGKKPYGEFFDKVHNIKMGKKYEQYSFVMDNTVDVNVNGKKQSVTEDELEDLYLSNIITDKDYNAANKKFENIQKTSILKFDEKTGKFKANSYVTDLTTSKGVKAWEASKRREAIATLNDIIPKYNDLYMETYRHKMRFIANGGMDTIEPLQTKDFKSLTPSEKGALIDYTLYTYDKTETYKTVNSVMEEYARNSINPSANKKYFEEIGLEPPTTELKRYKGGRWMTPQYKKGTYQKKIINLQGQWSQPIIRISESTTTPKLRKLRSKRQKELETLKELQQESYELEKEIPYEVGTDFNNNPIPNPIIYKDQFFDNMSESEKTKFLKAVKSWNEKNGKLQEKITKQNKKLEKVDEQLSQETPSLEKTRKDYMQFWEDRNQMQTVNGIKEVSEKYVKDGLDPGDIIDANAYDNSADYFEFLADTNVQKWIETNEKLTEAKQSQEYLEGVVKNKNKNTKNQFIVTNLEKLAKADKNVAKLERTLQELNKNEKVQKYIATKPKETSGFSVFSPIEMSDNFGSILSTTTPRKNEYTESYNNWINLSDLAGNTPEAGLNRDRFTARWWGDIAKDNAEKLGIQELRQNEQMELFTLSAKENRTNDLVGKTSALLEYVEINGDNQPAMLKYFMSTGQRKTAQRLRNASDQQFDEIINNEKERLRLTIDDYTYWRQSGQRQLGRETSSLDPTPDELTWQAVMPTDDYQSVAPDVLKSNQYKTVVANGQRQTEAKVLNRTRIEDGYNELFDTGFGAELDELEAAKLRFKESGEAQLKWSNVIKGIADKYDSNLSTGFKDLDKNLITDTLDWKFPLDEINSGGQTGVDQIGLKWAKDNKLKTGGVAPKGWKTIDGKDEALMKSYGLTENKEDGYKARTIKNVENTDGTVIFTDRTGSEAPPIRFWDNVGATARQELDADSGILTGNNVRYSRAKLRKISRSVDSKLSGSNKPLTRAELEELVADGTITKKELDKIDEKPVDYTTTRPFWMTGSSVTAFAANRSNKPFIINPTADELITFIAENKIKKLNVAGSDGKNKVVSKQAEEVFEEMTGKIGPNYQPKNLKLNKNNFFRILNRSLKITQAEKRGEKGTITKKQNKIKDIEKRMDKTMKEVQESRTAFETTANRSIISPFGGNQERRSAAGTGTPTMPKGWKGPNWFFADDPSAPKPNPDNVVGFSGGILSVDEPMDKATKEAITALRGLDKFEEEKLATEMEIITAQKEPKAQLAGVFGAVRQVLQVKNKHENASKIKTSMKDTIGQLIKKQGWQGTESEFTKAKNQLFDSITAKYPTMNEVTEASGTQGIDRQGINRGQWDSVIEQIVSKGVYKEIVPKDQVTSFENVTRIFIPGSISGKSGEIYVRIEPYSPATIRARERIETWMTDTANTKKRERGSGVNTFKVDEKPLTTKDLNAKLTSVRGDSGDKEGGLFKVWINGWRTNYATIMNDKSFRPDWYADDTVNINTFDQRRSGIAMVKGLSWSDLNFTNSGQREYRNTEFPNDWRIAMKNNQAGQGVQFKPIQRITEKEQSVQFVEKTIAEIKDYETQPVQVKVNVKGEAEPRVVDEIELEQLYIDKKIYETQYNDKRAQIEAFKIKEQNNSYLDNVTSQHKSSTVLDDGTETLVPKSLTLQKSADQVRDMNENINRKIKNLGLDKVENKEKYVVKNKGGLWEINVTNIRQYISDKANDAQNEWFEKTNFNNLPVDARAKAWSLFTKSQEVDAVAKGEKIAELELEKTKLDNEIKNEELELKKIETEFLKPYTDRLESVKQRMPELSEELQAAQALKEMNVDLPLQFIQKEHKVSLLKKDIPKFDPETLSNTIKVTTRYKLTGPSFIRDRLVTKDNISAKQYDEAKTQLKDKYINGEPTKQKQFNLYVKKKDSEGKELNYTNNYSVAEDVNGNKIFTDEEIKKLDLLRQDLNLYNETVDIWKELPLRTKLIKNIESGLVKLKKKDIDILDENISFHIELDDILKESENSTSAARMVARKLRENKRNREARKLEKLADEGAKIERKMENVSRTEARLYTTFTVNGRNVLEDLRNEIMGPAEDMSTGRMNNVLQGIKKKYGAKIKTDDPDLYNNIEFLINNRAYWVTGNSVIGRGTSAGAKGAYKRVLDGLEAFDLKNQLESGKSMTQLTKEAKKGKKKVDNIFTQKVLANIQASRDKKKKMLEYTKERDDINTKIDAILSKHLFDSNKAMKDKKAEAMFPGNEELMRKELEKVNYSRGGYTINEQLENIIQSKKESIASRNQLFKQNPMYVLSDGRMKEIKENLITFDEIGRRVEPNEEQIIAEVKNQITNMNNKDQSILNNADRLLFLFDDPKTYKRGQTEEQVRENFDSAVKKLNLNFDQVKRDNNINTKSSNVQGLLREMKIDIANLSWRPSTVTGPKKKVLDPSGYRNIKSWLKENGPIEGWDAEALSQRLYEEDTKRIQNREPIYFGDEKVIPAPDAVVNKITPKSLKAYIEFNANDLGYNKKPSKRNAVNVNLEKALLKLGPLEDAIKRARKDEEDVPYPYPRDGFGVFDEKNEWKGNKIGKADLEKERNTLLSRIDLLKYGDEDPADLQKMLDDARGRESTNIEIVADLQRRVDITDNRLQYSKLVKHQSILEKDFGINKKKPKTTVSQEQINRAQKRWNALEEQKEDLNKKLSRIYKDYGATDENYIPTWADRWTQPTPKAKPKTKKENVTEEQRKNKYESDERLSQAIQEAIEVEKETTKKPYEELTKKEKEALDKELLAQAVANRYSKDPLKDKVKPDEEKLRAAAEAYLKRSSDVKEFINALKAGRVPLKYGVPGKKGKKLKKVTDTVKATAFAGLLAGGYVGTAFGETTATGTATGTQAVIDRFSEPIRPSILQLTGTVGPRREQFPEAVSSIPSYNSLYNEVLRQNVSPSIKAQIVPRLRDLSRLDTVQVPDVRFRQAPILGERLNIRSRQRLDAVPITKPRLAAITSTSFKPITTPKRPFRPIAPIPPPPGFFLPPFPTRRKKRPDKRKKKKLKKLVWQVPDNPFGYYNPQEYAVQGSKAFKKYSKVQAIDL